MNNKTTFNTTLFEALAAADLILCNELQIVAKLLAADALLPPYIDLENGSTIQLQDVEIVIDQDGRAYSEHPENADGLVWRFFALQPLSADRVELTVKNPVKLNTLLASLRNKKLVGA